MWDLRSGASPAPFVHPGLGDGDGERWCPFLLVVVIVLVV